MSSITKCNYCKLRTLRRRAKASGEKIVLVGNTAYRIPQRMSKRDFLKLPVGTPDNRVGRSKYWVAWFMEITNHCCC